jgi:hypothetical protein
MEANVARWLDDIPPHTLSVIAAEMDVSVEDIRKDEGLAADAWGSYFEMIEEQNGGPSQKPAFARYIASQTMNPDGS